MNTSTDAVGDTVGDGSADVRDGRRAAIHRAAIEQFSTRGYRSTSMANIADAAAMSRPALYQYFRNKADIFGSAFVALFDEHVDRALDALDTPAPLADRLDGFLQRFDGDLWERMSASPYSDEILEAKDAEVTAAVAVVIKRLRDGLDASLEQLVPGQDADTRARRTGWAEVLELSPKGFKFDGPPAEAYRRRLTTLAHGIAADIATTLDA